MSSRTPAWQPPQRYLDAGNHRRHSYRWSETQGPRAPIKNCV